MKKVVLILLVALVPCLTFAQNTAVENLFDKYGGKDGFTTVNINGSLLKMVADMSDEEDMDALDDINTIKILVQEDAQASNFYDEVMGDLKRDNYEELMTVNSEDEDVIFLIKKSGETIKEFILVVGGDDDNALIYIGGNLRMKDLADLGKNMNIDGDALAHLEHLSELEK